MSCKLHIKILPNFIKTLIKKVKPLDDWMLRLHHLSSMNVHESLYPSEILWHMLEIHWTKWLYFPFIATHILSAGVLLLLLLSHSFLLSSFNFFYRCHCCCGGSWYPSLIASNNKQSNTIQYSHIGWGF